MAMKFKGLPDKSQLLTKILPDLRLIFCSIMVDFALFSSIGEGARPLCLLCI